MPPAPLERVLRRRWTSDQLRESRAIHRLNTHKEAIAQMRRFHDAAFDQVLIGFDDELRLILSKRLRDVLPNEAVKASFEIHSGQSLQLAADATPPDPSFLAMHRSGFEFW